MKMMKNPPHPGKTIRIACLEELDLTITEGAKILGVSRQALSNVVNEHSSISSEMAIRLSKAFGSSPDTWLRMQLNYDIAQAKLKEKSIKVKRYVAPHEDVSTANV